MSKTRRFLINWPLQLELLDNLTWAEAEVLADNFGEIRVGSAAIHGAVRVDVDAERVSKADSIGNLDENTVAQACMNERLCDIPAIIGS